MKLWHAMARGFTLVEIAIVLVIIGLIIGGGITAVSPILASSRATETRSKLEKIEAAVTLYASRFRCLPCPANGAIASGAANAGAALDSSGNYTTGCASAGETCVNTNGVVPWLNLGLSEADIVDAWGRRISFRIGGNGYTGGTPGFDASNPDDCAAPGPNLPVERTGGFEFKGDSTVSPPAICFPNGTLVVENADGTEITNAADRAVYILISHGRDGFGGWTGTGTQLASGFNSATQTSNTNAAGPFVQHEEISANGDAYFDDLVIWRSGAIGVRLCGDGACGNSV